MIKKVEMILFYVIAGFYLFMMIDLFFRFSYIFEADRVITRSYNLIPFQTIMEYARVGNSISFANVNLYGNVAAFVPYGLYVGVVRKRKEFMKCLAVIVVTSLVIEIVQLVFGTPIIFLYFTTVFGHLRL